MKPFRPIAAALALAACATATDAPPQPSFYVMRHLEKADGTDPGLTEPGRLKADHLPALLRHAPPKAVYASTTRRARETARPTAEEYRLEIHEYDPRDTPRLIARVKAERGPVLIVGHSNTVPAIVEALGGGRIGGMGEGDYGLLFTITPGRPGVYRQCIGPDCVVVGVDDDRSQ